MSDEPASDFVTLPGKLAAEISRVTALRAHYEEIGRLCGPQAMVGPAIALMTAAINNGIQAANSPDIVGQIVAVRDLEGFTE